MFFKKLIIDFFKKNPFVQKHYFTFCWWSTRSSPWKCQKNPSRTSTTPRTTSRAALVCTTVLPTCGSGFWWRNNPHPPRQRLPPSGSAAAIRFRWNSTTRTCGRWKFSSGPCSCWPVAVAGWRPPTRVLLLPCNWGHRRTRSWARHGTVWWNRVDSGNSGKGKTLEDATTDGKNRWNCG